MPEDLTSSPTVAARLDFPPARDRTMSTVGKVLRPLSIYATSRLLMLGATVTMIASRPRMTWNSAMRVWDSNWYLETAIHGYPHNIPKVNGRIVQNTLAFFPLYPLSIRGLHVVTGLSFLVSALLIATLTGAGFSVGLWWLIHRMVDPEAADRATWLVCLFPGFFVFALPYAEPMSLLLTVVCLYGLCRRWWWVAGSAAALASATRPNAAVLIVVCAWTAARAISRERDWSALAAPALAPIGTLAYFAFLQLRTGRFFAYETVNKAAWQFGFRPLEPVHLVEAFLRHPFAAWDVTLSVFGLTFLVAMSIWLVRSKMPTILTFYGIPAAAFAVFTDPRLRFVLTAFPLIVIAERLRGVWYRVVLALSAAGLCGMVALTLLGKATP